MGTSTDVTQVGGLKYATSFEEKLLGVRCDVDVIVDLSTGDASAVVAMRQMLSPSPAFRITLADLATVAEVIKTVPTQSKLLESLVDGATDHQLNFSHKGCTLTIVKPKGRPARYVLGIGLFNREGDLAELSASELTSAIEKLEQLKEKTRSKAMRPPK